MSGNGIGDDKGNAEDTAEDMAGDAHDAEHDGARMIDVPLDDPTGAGPATGHRKGRIRIVHLYPREMSIYGDRGNTRALAMRARRHGYDAEVHEHHPGGTLPEGIHLVVGGGGQDSGQDRVREDLERIGPMLTALADDGTPMLMICGMYQLFGHDFRTTSGRVIPGLGILDVTTKGNDVRMIGPVLLRTDLGDIVGYENHSGSTERGSGQAPLGILGYGKGNNGKDGTEGAVRDHVYGSYLHGPVLPANPAFIDRLLGVALDRVSGKGFEPAEIDDTLADQARRRQVDRLLTAAAKGREV
ncbi:type 1 glutamine amidotransferase [Mobilicoccus caccae]|uniref:Lipid II isoglutaminyl synthase (glutamine-hydrolyzing) subunit GatD n=1 Tax=Mobilicoccus caccae TaxID=1859295 RepID=A0ABQ6IKR0_9MICO|nr:cobalamin biosynthesis protein CobB [Mobilicoccus caccae]GMA38517.1 glutamine amidotransferase [Mobilicoccus caccae]